MKKDTQAIKKKIRIVKTFSNKINVHLLDVNVRITEFNNEHIIMFIPWLEGIFMKSNE